MPIYAKLGSYNGFRKITVSVFGEIVSVGCTGKGNGGWNESLFIRDLRRTLWVLRRAGLILRGYPPPDGGRSATSKVFNPLKSVLADATADSRRSLAGQGLLCKKNLNKTANQKFKIVEISEFFISL